MAVRKAVFAGSWYPASKKDCEYEIQEFLQQGSAVDPQKDFVAGIVPHAGWYFSGSIACNVVHAMTSGAAPDVIVVFGMHLHAQSPRYIMAEGAWETPFGAIDVHDEFAGRLIERFAFEIETPRKFSQDNTIELQLPFLKYFFKEAALVPIGVPPVVESLQIGTAVAAIASELGVRVKVIGSTDLTHYGHNYGFVSHGTGAAAVNWVRNENDRRVIDAMLEMSPEKVINEAQARQNACCAGAASTAIASAKQLGATRAQRIEYATSYDKRPGDSFVGYVGIVFE